MGLLCAAVARGPHQGRFAGFDTSQTWQGANDLTQTTFNGQTAVAIMTCYELGRVPAGHHRLEEANEFAQHAEAGMTALFGAKNGHTVLAGRLHREIKADLRRQAAKKAPEPDSATVK
jgi:hypothetical protein